MNEFFKGLNKNTYQWGDETYYLYDVSGEEVIGNQTDIALRHGYTTVVLDGYNGWFSLYTNPKTDNICNDIPQDDNKLIRMIANT